MIFLSHSWHNKPAARKVVEALATEQIPCWLDEQQLDYGARLSPSLLSAIAQSDVYLYLVSSAANNSEWVQEELKHAVGLEFEKKLEIIPVRLADNKDDLPDLLSGRIYANLDPTTGGAARLAFYLAKIDGHDHIPENCRLSATIRLEEHRLVHTLAQAREFSTDNEIQALLLDDQYEALDSLYWSVAEVRFPPVQGSPQGAADASQIVAGIHKQSRSIIQETQLICDRFLAVKSTDAHREYFDAGHERVLHLLLHRLRWNTTSLRSLRDDKKLDEEFRNSRRIPAPFDGPRCDFVSGGQRLGGVGVPKNRTPFPPSMAGGIPWGLTSPFADMLQSEVGTAVGELLALRFMAQTLPSTEMPSPESLTYGLS